MKKFYVIQAVNPVLEDFEVVGVFSKLEDAVTERLGYEHACIQELEMRHILDLLVQDRMIATDELIEKLLDARA